MIAHQWRQPINTIALLANNLYFDLELNTLNPETIKSSVMKTLDLTQELSKTIDDFKNFFRPDKETDEVSLEKIIDDALAVVGKTIQYGNIDLVRKNQSEILIQTYSRELVQVLVNILKNAKDAFETQTIATKTISIDYTADNDILTLTVCDNAGGINPEVIDKIFDPYFTTKEEMNGTGLGLYISKIIIEKHLRGRLYASNRSDGACFTIMLPRFLQSSEESKESH